ncbi:MAG: tetrathionate reductase family octaheme c-type cytochrome [Chloroflexota bacterium]
MQHPARFWYVTVLGLAFALASSGLLLAQPASAQPASQAVASPTPVELVQTVDHTKLAALQGPFGSPQEVTKACLSCHADAADEIMHTTHWTWEYVNETTGQTLGKRTLINNFCIDIQSNEPRCTSCHIGYGWKDKNFDFTAQENVDCLVCHDTTATYKKFPTAAGLPVSAPTEFPAGSGTIWNPPDLAEVAQNVGLTSRQTCGTCHFYGGGGDEVKHGDLDSSLVNPSFALDVHMSPEGQNFTCTTCHTTENHQTVGSRYSMDPEQWKGCESCHGAAPHTLAALNQHAQKVACQTCHIPEFARGGLPTKMTWDWSKAGELLDGKPVVRKDETGHVIYDGQKGEFTYGENVVPEYVWFNGQVQYTLAGDKIDPTNVVAINEFLGDMDDPNAKIWPVKRFEAVQPYDSVNDILAVPHLFGKDDFAYWGNYDWNKSIAFGMEYAGLPYSGEYAFVRSVMYWPITHMVAPASEALVCKDCHTAGGGRLDFAALGYDEDDVTRLTKFPPTLVIEDLITPQMAPDSCLECHGDEYELWTQSLHGEKGVGCVSCHKLETAGEHPAVPFTMEKSAETCGACHLDEYDDWKTSAHGQINVDCSSCHNPHSQQIMTIGDNQTACETCHRDTKEGTQHSTHAAAGLTCKDCHLNTDLNTGHTFMVGSDTCLKCHAETIHTSGLMIEAGVDVGQASATEAAPSAESTPEAAAEAREGAGIALPTWLLILVGLGLGAGTHWLLSTRRLSDLPDGEAESSEEGEREPKK